MTLLQFSTWFEVTTVAAETRRANGREDVGLPAEHEELQLNEEQEEQEEEPEVDDDDNNIEDPASAFALNPHWGESYRQPPFIKKLGEKGRKKPRFLLLSGNKGKVARMRKSPRWERSACFISIPSFFSTILPASQHRHSPFFH